MGLANKPQSDPLFAGETRSLDWMGGKGEKCRMPICASSGAGGGKEDICELCGMKSERGSHGKWREQKRGGCSGAGR